MKKKNTHTHRHTEREREQSFRGLRIHYECIWCSVNGMWTHFSEVFTCSILSECEHILGCRSSLFPPDMNWTHNIVRHLSTVSEIYQKMGNIFVCYTKIFARGHFIFMSIYPQIETYCQFVSNAIHFVWFVNTMFGIRILLRTFSPDIENSRKCFQCKERVKNANGKTKRID